ncbi:MAG: UDP-glucose/GDP-mannose dehydrogenase family protein [Bacteroidetes bacterium]|nr:UDP-glucose/GDP-mannose dehydrogenase family protein [Bacteroidota bacterium]MBP7255974.1 UDP-glucose/GDP-mannose dehydrogenase family protein [Chitinophagales bacterium]MBK7504506.1 UDP-glucose/GDP-mannose dehydrogenase family protein [Bacteroidota bacterium]MBK7641270.1 UDP-glucose/GDP-mannose dehydrogenase family protein [Bacteroidota bacterium]MBK8673596.1 UDP-glucose/GDP-mannose dehydrogenase family protein [Bacteroidota bacterium]
MNIAVIGTGYVGLVSGTCFAEKGNNVICVDIDEKKVTQLKAGQIPIYEPGLETIFTKNIEAGRLSFTTNLAEGIQNAEIIFLALPTPSDEDGSADLSYVSKCAEAISPLITDYKIIVNKSTVPVGTAEMVSNILSEKATAPFDVVSNPEFLREGSALKDFMNPDRVVIGSSSQRAIEKMSALYAPFIQDENQIVIGDEKSAEMSKYAANAYLSARLTFMNEIATLCEKVGANVDFIRESMGMDDRIGSKFLFPGIGFGGSCFPKDIRALVKTAKDNDYNFKILNSVIEVNESQKVVIVQRVKNYFKGNLEGKRITIWGLAFKPNTDDVRQASSLKIISRLLDEKAIVSVFDPVAMENVKKIFGDKIIYSENSEQAIKDADALIIVTEWNEFRKFPLELLANTMKSKVVFDGRNIFKLEEMETAGFYYESIGRPTVGKNKN